MGRTDKGQVATEYLVMLAFLLVAIVFVFSFALMSYRANSDVVSMKTSVNALAAAADQVYALGPGNTLFVEITVSDTVQSYALSDRTVSYFAVLSGESVEFFASAKANLSGELPLAPGRRLVKVASTASGVVFSEFTGE
ncbi:MAG: hypothetical protein HY917_03065 [Candidatus Diapherotrites archaeon]|nr:hypothetical protein [Candidatus Diapherotrites archaeon]